jgi:hypothetical protein
LFLDEDYVHRHTHRFVERVARVTTRNYPVGQGDFEPATFYYHRDGGWQDEDKLTQRDYDVWVTDARWLAPCIPA